MGLGVTLRAPIVLPWKARSKQTISIFSGSLDVSFACFLTNFSAPSLASAPELAKKTLAEERDAVDDEGLSPRPPCFLVSSTRRLAQGPAQALW